jgi:hypothetical protein
MVYRGIEYVVVQDIEPDAKFAAEKMIRKLLEAAGIDPNAVA